MLFNTIKTTTKTKKNGTHKIITGLALGLVLLTAGLLPGFDTNNKVYETETSKPAAAVADFSHTPSTSAFDAGFERNELSLRNTPVRANSRDPDRSASTLPVTAKAAANESRSEIETINLKLSSRYGNPVVERFVHSVSAEQSVRFYYEASQLVDARHLKPATYEVRVRQAMKNLAVAIENPDFLRANRLSPSKGQADAFRRELGRLFQSRRIATSNDALQMLYASIDLAGRSVGMKPTAVALEFVNGATESLDKYSGFVPLEQTRQPSADLEDHVVGIGVEIEPSDSGVKVRKVLSNGPAAKAGLRAGDVIVSVNGQKLEGKSLDYVVDAVTGPAGSRILLSVVRDGQTMSPLSLTRSRVKIESVSEVRMLEGTKTGYIKLDKFAQASGDEMDKALWSLYRQGMESLVIDLRGNPGGLLTTAIELSDKFLPSGTIVSTRGRTAEDQMMENAKFEQTWSTPLVVLVDGNSASASEIFAAAIQENGRGLVVGSHSYGKGTVQTHFPLQTVNGNLRLTTARFYSPNGRVMAGAGVEPDVSVALDASTIDAARQLDNVIERAIEMAGSQRLRDLALAGSNNRASGQRDLQLGG